MDDVTVTVDAVRAVGPDAIAIDFQSPDGFSAQPGQFVKLAADIDGEEESRFYTISSPDVEDTFEVTIEIDPDGALGPHLADLEAGDTLTMAGPYGSDYYDGEPRAVVLAGGPGVGPAIGIARRALAEGNEAAIVYADDTPIHDTELQALEEDSAFVAILDEDEDMTPAVIQAITNDESEQVFVYGFADFLESATAAIEAAGGDSDSAKVENFG
jgi:3-phenylpropionate/trans-cinnamate dioxygenase ferredoxin reductase subunit